MPQFSLDTSTPAKKLRLAAVALVVAAALFALGYLAGRGLYGVTNDGDGDASAAPVQAAAAGWWT